MTEKKKTLLGELLVLDEIITKEQLDEALKMQKTGDKRLLGLILIDLGYLNHSMLNKYLSKEVEFKVDSLKITISNVEEIENLYNKDS